MNNTLRDLIFGYVIAVIMTVTPIIKCYTYYKMLLSNSFNIAPIELKLGLWAKRGKVNIPTKFQEN